MPVAYARYMEKKAAMEKRAAAAASSEYAGVIGKRMTITAATAVLVTSWPTAYGATFLYRFTDGDGHTFVWKASRHMDVKDGMKIKGTVKEHSEYRGIKQTVLTRCAVA